MSLEIPSNERIELSERMDWIGLDMQLGWFTDYSFPNPNRSSRVPSSVSGEINELYKGEHGADLNFDTHTMFVYCNLVKETLVGDKYVPWLRIVPTNPKDTGRYLTHSFQTMQYLALSSSHINHIEIMIIDDTGTGMKFDRGKVIATLHFKKKTGNP